MRLWILVGGCVLVVLAAMWPFGRRTEQLAPVPVPPQVAAKPAAAEKPKPEPVIEMIDLARAYEPVREADESAGAVNPASFIQVPEGPRRIPAGINLDDPFADVIRTVQDCVSGPFLLGAGVISEAGVFPRDLSTGPVERIEVLPREVLPIGNGLLNFAPAARATGELVFVPMGAPYATGIPQPIPPNASIQNGLLNFTPVEAYTPVEALKVMPREAK